MTVVLEDAKILAELWIEHHNLVGWSFEFDNAQKRFGCCNFNKKRITLSRILTTLNSEAEVEDTILHEIAHALVDLGTVITKFGGRRRLKSGAAGSDVGIVRKSFRRNPNIGCFAKSAEAYTNRFGDFITEPAENVAENTTMVVSIRDFF